MLVGMVGLVRRHVRRDRIRTTSRLGNEVLSIQWNEMRYTEIQDSSDSYSFWHACILFFYVSDLPKKFPDIDGALHKLWMQTYKSPMKAEDLESTPIGFKEEETAWCKQTIESLQRLLTAEQREKLGLRPPTKRQARTKLSQQQAQAEKRKGAQNTVPRGDAAEASDESDDVPALPGLKTARRCVSM